MNLTIADRDFFVDWLCLLTSYGRNYWEVKSDVELANEFVVLLKKWQCVD